MLSKPSDESAGRMFTNCQARCCPRHHGLNPLDDPWCLGKGCLLNQGLLFNNRANKLSPRSTQSWGCCGCPGLSVAQNLPTSSSIPQGLAGLLPLPGRFPSRCALLVGWLGSSYSGPPSILCMHVPSTIWSPYTSSRALLCLSLSPCQQLPAPSQLSYPLSSINYSGSPQGSCTPLETANCR